MPYLDQGEYFNDFADYLVTVHAPKGYIVAATGNLMDVESDTQSSSWSFVASNVIDFAWFASPHFEVQQKEIEIEEGRYVQLSVYIDTLHYGPWGQALSFAERALSFYSEWLGPYPYEHMSVVSAPFSKGGYMEYPMLAQISETTSPEFLDIVIAHEVGHTWLYGVLADNERADPWMDEGLNTFMEHEYVKANYPGYEELLYPQEFNSPHSMSHYDAVQHVVRFANKLEPPASPPEHQSGDQYLYSAYLLPAEGLALMQAKFGQEKMKAMFRQYYKDNQFKHVSPIDLRVSFEKTCDCDLSWFFDTWIHEAQDVNYKIRSFNRKKKN